MSSDTVERIEREAILFDRLFGAVSRVIIGQERLLRRMIMGLLSGGHILLEGVPGLAKSLAVESLAAAAGLAWRRIQFTPDLLPADIVGTPIYQPASGRFETKRGPIFANLVLADEVNRAPAKVHSALLEAMQERKVSIGEESHVLPEPFHVLATQNPIEHEGTYSLPEAALDRFLFKLVVEYPTAEEEAKIVTAMARTSAPPAIEPVADAARILEARRLVDAIHVEPRLIQYALSIVRATRDPASSGLLDLRKVIRLGASPRASIALVLAARTAALLRGRPFAAPSDVKEVAIDVLRHRVTLTFEAEADGFTPERVLEQILDRTPVP